MRLARVAVLAVAVAAAGGAFYITQSSRAPRLVETTAAPAPAVPASNAPLALQDVAGPGEGSNGSTTSTMTEAAPASSGGTRGNSVGVEVLTPGVSVGTAPTGTAADTPHGLKAVGPDNTAAVPGIEKPAEAPDQLNEVAGKPQPATPAATDPNKKTPKPAYDKDDESSSKHKKKKGLAKLNPL